MKQPTKQLMFSSNYLAWGTPPELFKELNDEFHFKCDPCTTLDNPLGIETFYTPETDGLAQSWTSPAFVNPPYGREIGKWVRKSSEQSKAGKLVVMLLPARTDTRYFHDYLYKQPDVEIRFLKGRLRFVGSEYRAKSGAPFPSMVCVMGGSK